MVMSGSTLTSGVEALRRGDAAAAAASFFFNPRFPELVRIGAVTAGEAREDDGAGAGNAGCGWAWDGVCVDVRAARASASER